MTQYNLAESMARVIGGDGDRHWFEFGLDPASAEAVGQNVAEKLQARSPNVVLCLEHEEDAVLAHIVARQLGATRVVLREQAGLLWFSHDLASDSRVAVISADPARVKSREVLHELLGSRDAQLVAVVVLTAGDAASTGWAIRDA